MDFIHNHETDQLVYRYSLREQESGELYNGLLSIYLCELPRQEANSLDDLDPIQSWFYIMEKLRTLAGEPEEMGRSYAAVAEAARMYTLPDDEKIRHFNSLLPFVSYRVPLNSQNNSWIDI